MDMPKHDTQDDSTPTSSPEMFQDAANDTFILDESPSSPPPHDNTELHDIFLTTQPHDSTDNINTSQCYFFCQKQNNEHTISANLFVQRYKTVHNDTQKLFENSQSNYYSKLDFKFGYLFLSCLIVHS